MHFAELKKYLAENDVIPIRMMAEIYDQEAFGQNVEEERSLASSINAEVGAYLPSFLLRRFISAELSDEDAAQISMARKLFLERSASLLPSLMVIFAISNSKDFSYFVNYVEECYSDFSTISASPHRKRARREVRKNINDLVENISILLSALDKAKHHIEITFQHHIEANDRLFSNSAVYPKGLELFHLKNALEILSLSSRLVLLNDETGKDQIYITDNRAKTYIVEAAYQMSIHLRRPSLVTTPGSDFSFACAILYEIASGEQEVSLAGAINKFARSAERKRIDLEEAEFQFENSDEGMRILESDNFSHITDAMKKEQAQLEYWSHLWSERDWVEGDRRHFAIRMREAEESLKRLSREHGPFLVWGSQYSEADRREWRELTERHEENALKAAISLGIRRRARRD